MGGIGSGRRSSSSHKAQSNMGTVQKRWMPYNDPMIASAIDAAGFTAPRAPKLYLEGIEPFTGKFLRAFDLAKAGHMERVMENAWGLLLEDVSLTLACTHPRSSPMIYCQLDRCDADGQWFIPTLFDWGCWDKREPLIVAENTLVAYIKNRLKDLDELLSLREAIKERNANTLEYMNG